MSLFSKCSDCGRCCLHFTGDCLAGNGDDHFSPISAEAAENIIINGYVRSHYAIEELYEMFPEIKEKCQKTINEAIQREEEVMKKAKEEFDKYGWKRGKTVI